MSFAIEVKNDKDSVIGSVKINGASISCTGVDITYRAKDFPHVVIYGVALPVSVDVNTPSVIFNIGDKVFKLMDVTDA